MKTIKEYICDNLEDNSRSEFIQFLNSLDDMDYRIDKIPEQQFAIDEFYRYISKETINQIRILLTDNFNINCFMTPHFIIRLITRFGDMIVDIMMLDIKYTFIRRSAHAKKRGVLKSHFYKIIYSEKDKVFITIKTKKCHRIMRQYNRSNVPYVYHKPHSKLGRRGTYA